MKCLNWITLRVKLKPRKKMLLSGCLVLTSLSLIILLIRHHFITDDVSVPVIDYGIPCQSNNIPQKHLKHIKLTEFYYANMLKSLASDEIGELNQFYHRDVAIHWGSRHGLLPEGKSIPHISCLRHLDSTFKTSVSVVMCMRNELVYLLLRTLTTIVRRTPGNLLREIVLIDDGSDEDCLPEVKNYCSKLNIPLRTFRNDESVGITSCRRFGIEKAEGDVIVLLDSHMEVSDLWLEPLLDILMSKPDAIAVPTLHLINEKYYESLHQQVCEAYGIEAVAGYSYFRYYSAGPPEKNQSAPYYTASVLGGALAAYRSTFLRLYPQTVFGELWGTENTRLAIRAWLCGEGLWMTRCSQVLHTNGNDGELKRYTSRSPDMKKHLQYETVGDISNFIEGNEEKTRFLQSVYSDDNEVEIVRDVSKTIYSQFNAATQCSKDYYWYLTNIFPNPHFYQFGTKYGYYNLVGEFHTKSKPNFCIYANNQHVLINTYCQSTKLYFHDPHLLGLSIHGEVHVIWNYLFCFDAGANGGQGEGVRLITYSCHTQLWPGTKPGNSQVFSYNQTSQQIVHTATGRCAQADFKQAIVTLWQCSDVVEQKWVFHKARWS